MWSAMAWSNRSSTRGEIVEHSLTAFYAMLHHARLGGGYNNYRHCAYDQPRGLSAVEGVQGDDNPCRVRNMFNADRPVRSREPRDARKISRVSKLG